MTQRPYLSQWHLMGARDRRDDAAVTEREGLALARHRACVVGAIVAATCVVEAVAHEAFMEAHAPSDAGYLRSLPAAVLASLRGDHKKLRDTQGAGWTFLDRILRHAKRPRTSVIARRDVEVLYALRDALVHGAVPSVSADFAAIRPAMDLAKELSERGIRAHRTDLEARCRPWPERLMSAHLATWSVAAAETYLQDFALSLGIARWWEPQPDR